jgi:hypothetical protein
MKISKHFTKSGAGNMLDAKLGHGVDFVTRTVRMTIHRPDNHMAHISLTPEEALQASQELMANAMRIVSETQAYPRIEAQSSEVDDLIRAGKMMAAIHKHRAETGLSLMESRHYVIRRQAEIT